MSGRKRTPPVFEEVILPRLRLIAVFVLAIFMAISAIGGFLAGQFFYPHCPAPELGTLSGGPIPADPLPPGQPPLPVVATPDAVLAYALGDLWPYTSARDQAALREMLHPLQNWARDHWPPFPDATPACP
jgi:hypothetical protein